MGFQDAFEDTVMKEGGYSNNPMDSGGATKYGITEQVARAHGWTGSMMDLPLDNAKYIYRAQYWNQLRLDDICNLSEAIAYKLFEIGVNCGIGTAGTFLQRLLNVLNRGQSDFPDLKVDGVVGPVTVSNLAMFLRKRGLDGNKVILIGLRSLQGCHYITLAEKREKDETFTFGWLLHRAN